MSNPYQPFLISEFKTGLNNYLQPWIRPNDAFEPLTNCYINRGTLNKRAGSTQYGNQLDDTNPVMGILQRIDEATGISSLVALSTENAYLYNIGANTFDRIVSIGGSSSVFWMGTATGTIAMPTFWPNLVPSSVSITDGTTTITDNGTGTFSSGGIFAAGGTINYTTGSISLNFTGTTARTSLSLTATTTGDYFTGTIVNFFNSVNWQPTDPVTFVSSTSFLYMTNNVDPITLFDGTNLSRPILYVNSGNTDYITNCIDLGVYKNRFLAVRPTLNSTSNALNQSVFYSALYNPTNFIADVAGNGGQISAATGDIIQSTELLRDAIVVFFSNSTWLFRYTGVEFDPFRFDKINSSKSNTAPYGTLTFDERVTSMGVTGFIACDGANVQRYDEAIIDYYETKFSTQYFDQTFAKRYDNLNQAWMLYVSQENNFPLVGSVAPGSDKALIYNFFENTWATYSFAIPMTCLGLFYSISGTTWASLTQAWEDTDVTWDSFTNQKAAPILLGGDTNGYVYHMIVGDAVTDANGPTPGSAFTIVPEVLTTRWNPVLQTGQKTQFGYIDIYYSIASIDPGNPIILTLDFTVDNSNQFALTRQFTLDGPINSGYTFKRIYLNLIGEFVQMNIDPSEDSFFQIVGFILWARPAGRLTR